MSEGIGGPTVLRDDAQHVDGGPRFAAPPTGWAPLLSRRDRLALLMLAQLEPGHYLVQPPFLDISNRSYKRLREYGAFEEVWNWTCHTRPNIALSAKGRALLGDGGESRPPSGVDAATGAQATEGTNP